VVLLPAVVLLALAVPTGKIKYKIKVGDEVIVCNTRATQVREVLQQAGIDLDENDTYTKTVIDDGTAEICVRRVHAITLYDCGKEVKVSSPGETVQAFLERMHVPYTDEYVISAKLTDMTYDGMELRVDYIVHDTHTYTQDIPYGITYCYDADMAADQQIVMVPGQPGQKQVTADVTYVNRQETQRNVIGEMILQQPTNAVVVVGTGENTVGNGKAPAIGDGVIVTADGQVLTYNKTAVFKATAYTHTDAGCDMTTATGTTVHIGTVAVDPKVIPYGTRMFIVTNDGAYVYGISTAEDCGAAIKGEELDLYFPTDPECWEFGVRMATIYFLD
jgi:uncharacterized protein YabE (DUF348 family)/3D (Asp-Asp-Asp) domain-containing protein